MKNLVRFLALGLSSLLLLTTPMVIKAQVFNIEQLPFSFEGQWHVCVQKTPDAQLNCKPHQVPLAIEDSFVDFDGYIIYRNQFHISDKLSEQSLAIYIETVRDSDELYLNDVLIDKTGEFGQIFQKATLYSRYYYLPSHLLKPNETNHFDIKIFNHTRHGGIVPKAPVMDTAKNISHLQVNKNSSIMFYICIFFIIATIQLFYYFSQRTHREHLIFALFSLTNAVYLYTYSDFIVILGFDLSLVFRINIFLFATLSILFCLFISEFFRYKANRFIKFTLLVLATSAVLQLFILPLDWIYYQVLWIDFVGIFILIPYYIYLVLMSIKQRIPYAKIMASVTLLHIIAAFNDILTDLQIMPPMFSGIAGLISPISLFILFVTTSLILTHRHWLHYRHATYDYLTDALRRSAFIERLSEEIPRSQRLNQPLLIALLDIDNFKQINDQYTHVAGDQVLRFLVQRIRQELREFDLLSRYGGDEFCIAAIVADTSDAVNLLKRVQNRISVREFTLDDNQHFPVSITIGAYVTVPEKSYTPEDLIKIADEILIKGKVKQKGKIHI